MLPGFLLQAHAAATCKQGKRRKSSSLVVKCSHCFCASCFVTLSPVYVYAAATCGQQHDVSSQREGNTSSLEVQASYCSCASCSRLCTRSSSSPHSARNPSTSVLCEEALQCSRKHLLMLYPRCFCKLRTTTCAGKA